METMSHKQLVSIISIISTIGIIGCTYSYETNPKQELGNRASSEFVTRIENCDIYQLNVENVPSYLYLAKCTDTNNASIRNTFGKGQQNATITEQQVTDTLSAIQSNNVDGVVPNELSTEEQKVLDAAHQIQRKYEILDKLSTEEKAAIGFKTAPEILGKIKK